MGATDVVRATLTVLLAAAAFPGLQRVLPQGFGWRSCPITRVKADKTMPTQGVPS